MMPIRSHLILPATPGLPDNPIMSRDALTEPLYSQGCDLDL
jgi:hypothetical protein